MISRRDLAGWLQGPGGDPGATATGYPGQRLGLPPQGPGSVGRVGRRVVGVSIDWLFALLIANGLLRGVGWGEFAPLLVFLTMHVVLVGTAGYTAGHWLAGLRVRTVTGGTPGPVRALGRALLLCLVIPAAIWDVDQRGLHDKAVGTLVVRR